MRSLLPGIVAGAVVCCGLTAAAQAAEAPAPDQAALAQPSVWQHHEAKFTYMGFTTAYSCDALEGKVAQILKHFGARKPEVRASGCPRGPNSLSHMIWVQVKFDTLGAAGSDATAAEVVQAQWMPVRLDGQRPFFMGTGDCELIDNMKPLLLANFSTRNLSYDASCTPHQVTFADFRIQGEVLKGPAEHPG
jgi:hypothetical protein